MGVTHAVMDSPLGELTLVGSDGVLKGLYFAGQPNRRRPGRPVDALRHALYGRLLPIARDWYARLGRKAEWPDTLDE
jgi:hypothetical protein